jgi:16S rRNA (guanine(966)-N(2))-methyltransferase RsmD
VGELRVIGGELRGRRLRTPRGETTRPTSSRAREALFGWLGAHTEDADVLDLFAGSGALGIEALSRGARSAVFVERAIPALGALRDNLKTLELLDRTRVVGEPVERALVRLRRERARFALILADPPYRSSDLPDLAARAQLAELLLEDGVLVVEREERAEGAPTLGDPATGALWLRESRSYGRTSFDWYERRGAEGELDSGEEVGQDVGQDSDQGEDA